MLFNFPIQLKTASDGKKVNHKNALVSFNTTYFLERVLKKAIFKEKTFTAHVIKFRYTKWRPVTPVLSSFSLVLYHVSHVIPF